MFCFFAWGQLLLLLFFFFNYYFSTLRCKTLCDVTRPYFRVRLDDQFQCFDCLCKTQKWLIRRHNGGGSENVVQTGPCSREMVKFREIFKRSVLTGLEELLNKNQVFQRQSNFIRSVSHNLSKCFSPNCTCPPSARFSYINAFTVTFANSECINVRINYTGAHQQFHHINLSVKNSQLCFHRCVMRRWTKMWN